MTISKERDPLFVEANKIKNMIDYSDRKYSEFTPEQVERVHGVLERKLYRLSNITANLLVEAFGSSKDEDERRDSVSNVLERVILASDIISGVDDPSENSINPAYVRHLALQVDPVEDIAGKLEQGEDWSERVEVQVARPAVYGEIEANSGPTREKLLIAA